MSYQDQLAKWLQDNRPELFEQIKPHGLNNFRAMDILNQETGANVRMLDTVEDGCRRFLEALKLATTSGASSAS